MKKHILISPYYFLIIFLSVLSISAQNHVKNDKLNRSFEFGTMGVIKLELAFESKEITAPHANKGLHIEFNLIEKSIQFISKAEHFFRRQSLELDTTNVGYVRDWNVFSIQQKLEIVEQKKAEAGRLADEIHRENNQGQHIVSIVNSTRKQINIPSICEDPAMVLQAKDTDGHWKTIRHLPSPSCGNCYAFTSIAKKSKQDMIVELPTSGNYKTVLRFKMIYKKQFIYSEEIPYNIDYCDFFEEGQIGEQCIDCDATAQNTLDVMPTFWE